MCLVCISEVSVTADIVSDVKSAIIDEVKNQVLLAIMSPDVTQQRMPQDLSLPSASGSPLQQQDLQSTMIQLLMEQNSLLKRICHVFETNGATPIDVQSGSIVFTLNVMNRKGLRKLWNSYQDGRLQTELQEIMITKDLEKQAGCSLYLQLQMDEKKYYQGLEFFGKQGRSTISIYISIMTALQESSKKYFPEVNLRLYYFPRPSVSGNRIIVSRSLRGKFLLLPE